MILIASLGVGAMLFWVGYYLGKQLGRTEHVRQELCHARQSKILEYRAALATARPRD